jgi:hypothetical protein
MDGDLGGTSTHRVEGAVLFDDQPVCAGEDLRSRGMPCAESAGALFDPGGFVTCTATTTTTNPVHFIKLALYVVIHNVQYIKSEI